MTATPTTANSAILRASMIASLAQLSFGRTNTPLPVADLELDDAAFSADFSSGLERISLQLRSPPDIDIGRYASSCGSWSPYSVTGTIPMALSEAIIATYITIHIARSP